MGIEMAKSPHRNAGKRKFIIGKINLVVIEPPVVGNLAFDLKPLHNFG